MNERRVVITGLGAVTPIGLSVDEFWNNALSGMSGADNITQFDTTNYKTKFAAEVKDFDPQNFMDRKLARRMDRFSHFAVASASMAIGDADFNFDSLDKERVGVLIGSGIGGMWTNWEQQKILLEGDNPKHISPFFVPMLISDIAAGYVSIQHGFKGPNYATTSACATSSHALGDSLMLIQRGSADVMITGGAEAAICPMGVSGFNSARALSTRNDDPKAASRPFERDRDGFVMGEGGAVLVLEELEHALKRGATIYAEFTGMGFTGDAHHITEPPPGHTGAVRSMNIAIKDAGATADEIDVVNAHGTSTPLNDKNETMAIKTVFGQHADALKVNSTKSMTGHLLGASGAIEAIASILMVKNDKVHPTINFFNADPELDLDFVPNKPIDHPVNMVLTNSFGFGGHNVSLVFRKYQGD